MLHIAFLVEFSDFAYDTLDCLSHCQVNFWCSFSMIEYKILVGDFDSVVTPKGLLIHILYVGQV